MADGVDGRVRIGIELDDDRFQQQLRQTEGNVGNVFGSSGSARNAVSGFGTVMQNAFGHLIAEAVSNLAQKMVECAESVWQAGVSFESAFTGVMKTVDETADISYDDLREDIRAMAKDELPSTVEEISAVAEAAGQLGISTDKITEFSRVMIDMGNSTNLVSTEAASSLAKLANVTKMDSTQYQNLGSAIVDLGNNFATTERDIVSMSTRLAATAHTAGINEQGILGLSTALSSVGIEAEAGGTAMSTFIKKMQTAVETSSANLKKFAEVSGMTSDEFKALFKEDGAQAIDAFISGLARIDSAGGSALSTLQDMGFKEVRLSNALLALSGAQDLLTRTLATSNAAWEENTALSKEATKRYETTASQIQMMKNAVNDFYITISEQLQVGFNVGPIKDTINQLNDALKNGGFNGFIEEMQNIFGISNSTMDALRSLARQAPALLDTLISALKTSAQEAEKILGDILKRITDLLPVVIDGLEWIANNGDVINAIMHAFIGMMIAEKVTAMAASVSSLAASISQSGIAATAATAGINGYVIAIAGAAVAGTVIAGAIDNATERIHNEAQAYIEVNQEIAEQIKLLDELYKTDKKSGYESANSGVEDTKAELNDVAHQIRDIHIQREGLRKEYDNAGKMTYDELAEKGIDYTAMGNQLDEYDKQLSELEERKIYLQNLQREQEYIIADYANEFSLNEITTSREITQAMLNEADTRAKAVIAANQTHAQEVKKSLSEEEAKNKHYLAEMSLETGEISEAEYYNQIESIANQLDAESDLYKQYAKEIASGRRQLAEENAQSLADAQEVIYSKAQKAASKELAGVKSNLTELSNTYKSQYSNIISLRDRYKQKLMGESIFTVATDIDQKTGEESTTYEIDNLTKRLKEQEKYAKAIANLQNRDVSDGILSELDNLSTEDGLVFAEQLNKMSDKEFNELNEAYKKLDDTTTDLANERYKSELDQLQNDFISKATGLFDGMSSDLMSAGMNSAKAFISGFDISDEDSFKELDTYISSITEKLSEGIDDGSIDLTETLGEVIGNSDVGTSLVDNIIGSLNDKQSELSSALEKIFSTTGLDIQIKSDVQNSAAVASSAGYTGASNIVATQPTTTATTTATPESKASTVTIAANLQLTDKGGQIIADIVNEKNKQIEIQGGT